MYSKQSRFCVSTCRNADFFGVLAPPRPIRRCLTAPRMQRPQCDGRSECTVLGLPHLSAIHHSPPFVAKKNCSSTCPQPHLAASLPPPPPPLPALPNANPHFFPILSPNVGPHCSPFPHTTCTLASLLRYKHSPCLLHVRIRHPPTRRRETSLHSSRPYRRLKLVR